MSERIIISFTHDGDDISEHELDDLTEEVGRVVQRLVPGARLEDSYTEDV